MSEHQKPTDLELENRFSYHCPKGDQGDRYALIRRECGKLARVIVANTPVSREQARALNALDEAMMLSIAAIAHNE